MQVATLVNNCRLHGRSRSKSWRSVIDWLRDFDSSRFCDDTRLNLEQRHLWKSVYKRKQGKLGFPRQSKTRLVSKTAHPRPKRNGNLCMWRLKSQKVYCSLRGCIRKNWNDTEKGFFLVANYFIVLLWHVSCLMTFFCCAFAPNTNSMAPAQGWHAVSEW